MEKWELLWVILIFSDFWITCFSYEWLTTTRVTDSTPTRNQKSKKDFYRSPYLKNGDWPRRKIGKRQEQKVWGVKECKVGNGKSTAWRPPAKSCLLSVCATHYTFSRQAPYVLYAANNHTIEREYWPLLTSKIKIKEEEEDCVRRDKKHVGLVLAEECESLFGRRLYCHDSFWNRSNSLDWSLQHIKGQYFTV